MTDAIEEIAGRDAYVVVAEGTVLDVTDDGLVLSRTPFYARGGGQPGDTGILRWDGGEVRVVDTVRRQGRVTHVVEGDDLPGPGTLVEGRIDWDRRYLTMRTTPPCMRCPASCTGSTGRR